MPVTNKYKNVFNSAANSVTGTITIDLAARYAAAFGMLAAGKQLQKLFIKKDEDSNYNFNYYPSMSSLHEDVKMEIPNMEALEFSAVLQGNAGRIFAPPLLMTFTQEKSLIETVVNDADPVIVERWGTKAWNISMQGILINFENHYYPTDEIRRLNKNWQYNGVVKVVGTQFEERDIDSLYFKSINFSPIEGFQDTIKFTIEASSIKAVNFTLLKPNTDKQNTP